jgi:Fe-S-cluster containining protein
MSNYLDEILPAWPEKAVAKRRENRDFFKRLKNQDKKQLDQLINRLHEEVFACTDCLKCANCCTTTGPLLTDKDIGRLAKYEGMRPAAFTETFLHLDEDGDYIFKQMPCRYLNGDNTCRIYDIRPKACREYPHTDRHKQHQILNLTRKNAEVCPAVFEIVERLKSKLVDKLKR